MKNIFLAFFLLFTFHLFSQTLQAELIFTDGTSVEGYGTITSKNKIMFRVEPEDELEVWEHYVVKGIYLNNSIDTKYFEYVKIKQHLPPKLLEAISMGKVNLYREIKKNSGIGIQIGNIGIGFNQSTSNMFNDIHNIPRNRNEVTYKFYLKRENEKIATNATKKFKKVGLKYFDDCETIKEMFETNEFRKYSNKEIVDQYNVFCE